MLSPELSEFVAQGDRVLIVGLAKEKIKTGKKTREDILVFTATIQDDKWTNLQKCVDTHALGRATAMKANPSRGLHDDAGPMAAQPAG